MAITKEIIKYTSYKDNGYEVRVYDIKTIIVCPPLQAKYELQDLPEHRMEAVQPILDHIEAEKNHKFNPIIEE